MKFTVLYEDNHLLVIDKPPGWIVQGALPEAPSLFVEVGRYLKAKYSKPGNVYVGVVSRLDRWVSGVLPFAKTSKAAARLSEQFRRRSVDKRYWAIVTGSPRREDRTLRHWLVRDESRAKSYCRAQSVTGASEAVLTYEIAIQWDRYSLLDIRLETGRKHQIRAQLEAIGCPVVGDEKYGSPIHWESSIALHCQKLSLDHPTLATRLTWTSPMPSRWKSLGVPSSSEWIREDEE